jgi:DNA-directed RNA polymerase specialized sigma24 family protein
MNGSDLALDGEIVRSSRRPPVLVDVAPAQSVSSSHVVPSHAAVPSSLQPGGRAVVYDAPMLEACLRGDREATRALVDELTPVIQSRAARAVLRRRRHGVVRDLKQEVEELVQEVLLLLFADGGRVLRSWDPNRGLSLRNFVGLVAEREISDILQSGRRRPWNEQRTAEEPTDAQVGASPGPEAEVAARELFTCVIARLREELSPQGFQLFEMLLVDDCAVEDACAATGMSRDAIYAWRSRLPKIARRIAAAISTG